MPRRPSKSAKYENVWRDLNALANRNQAASSGRLEKDGELLALAKKHDPLIQFGMGPRDVVEVRFDRNMMNYIARTHGINADFREKLEAIFKGVARRVGRG